jgi:hypothetical protein
LTYNFPAKTKLFQNDSAAVIEEIEPDTGTGEEIRDNGKCHDSTI